MRGGCLPRTTLAKRSTGRSSTSRARKPPHDHQHRPLPWGGFHCDRRLKLPDLDPKTTITIGQLNAIFAEKVSLTRAQETALREALGDSARAAARAAIPKTITRSQFDALGPMERA